VTFFILSYEYDPVVKGDIGGYRKIWELAENLERLGHQVVLFSPRLEARGEGRPGTVIDVLFCDLPVLRPLTIYLFLFLAPLLRARRMRPDILYIRTLHSPLPALLAKLLPARLIVEVNGDSYAQLKAAGSSTLRLSLVKWIDGINLRFADRVIPITRGLQRMVHERYGLALEQTSVIESGSNVDLFRPEDPKTCRERLHLDPKGCYVGFMGTFFHYQGIDTLIEAAPKILERVPDARFLIVGDGVMREAWQTRVVADGLRDAFLFPGRVPYAEAPDYINSMDVCIAPFLSTRGETSPLKLFDYLACGKPVVVSDISSVREVIRDSGGMVAVTAEEPGALAEAIIALLADEGRRRLLGERGRAFVVAHHSWRSVAHRVAIVCQEAIEARRRKPSRASGF
jgi:glycosyltransferase involved in cell wall biosynthesis